MVDTIYGVSPVPWQVYSLIQDIRTYFRSFSQIRVQHIYRETNQAMDYLSKIGHTVTREFIDEYLYPELTNILYKDRLRRTLVRRGS